MKFEPWPKMARLSRECIITEKIDGTNAQVCIVEKGAADTEACIDAEKAVAEVDGKLIFAGSRTRWVTPGNDNYGFATWVKCHADELVHLGPGRHFGEWWGAGIQRKYGYVNGRRRFSLFNTIRYTGQANGAIDGLSCEEKFEQGFGLNCCGVVPVLYRGNFSAVCVEQVLANLKETGSQCAPGFMDPEGIIIYHVAAGVGFKKTIIGDESPKSAIITQ